MRSGFYLGLTLPLLLAMAVNAYGLTTFGKSQNNPQQQQPSQQQPVLKGRECQFENDCMALQNTSCVPDPGESKTRRCLCGDNKAPVNGICKNKFKGPNHSCSSNEECREGSECMANKDKNGAPKICKCSEGYVEIDFSCSGATSEKGLTALVTLLVTALLAGTSTSTGTGIGTY